MARRQQDDFSGDDYDDHHRRSKREPSRRSHDEEPKRARNDAADGTALIAVMQREFKNMSNRIAEQMDDRFDAVQRTLRDHGKRADETERRVAEHETKIEEALNAINRQEERLEKSFAELQVTITNARPPTPTNVPVAQAAPPQPPSSSSNGFDRPARDTVVEGNVHGNKSFSKDEFKKRITEILSEKGLVGEFDVPGPELSRKFRAFFKGPACGELVQSLLRARKDQEGAWVPYNVKDPEGEDIRFYYGPDKPPKVAKLESITRKFSRYLESQYAEHKFFGHSEEGLVSCDGTRVAWIEVTPQKATLQWNPVAIEGTHINKEAMSTYFNRTFNIQWCP